MNMFLCKNKKIKKNHLFNQYVALMNCELDICPFMYMYSLGFSYHFLVIPHLPLFVLGMVGRDPSLAAHHLVLAC